MTQETTKEFGSTTAITTGETQSSVLAEQAKAAVQARFIMAIQRPRDMDDVRQRLLKECRRPGFAAVAKYSVPRGGKRVIGPSIRFAEAAVRCMTNIQPEKVILFDDPERRIVRVTVTDLECNVTYSEDIILQKTTERKFLKDGEQPLSTRINSNGEPTYLVRATEDDVRNKEAAAVSKSIRGLSLRILPGDLQEEGMRVVDATLRDEHAKDPDADRKKIVDAFASVNVLPGDLKKYLGCEIAQASPADILDLRQIFQAMRDGETTWRDVVASKIVESPPQEEVKNTATDKLKAKAAKVSARQSQPEPEQHPDDPPEPGSYG